MSDVYLAALHRPDRCWGGNRDRRVRLEHERDRQGVILLDVSALELRALEVVSQVAVFEHALGMARRLVFRESAVGRLLVKVEGAHDCSVRVCDGVCCCECRIAKRRQMGGVCDVVGARQQPAGRT